jgi:hypothetical protein
MKLLITLFLSLSMIGCTSIKDKVPSFWDDNQSKISIDIRQEINHLDCSQPHLPQIEKIQSKIEWFLLYSESKQTKDVLKLLNPMTETVGDFYTRSKEKEGSEAYCNIKKKIMSAQAKLIAETIHGRF